MNDNKTEIISLRLTKKEKEILKYAARKENRSISNYILSLILKAGKEN